MSLPAGRAPATKNERRIRVSDGAVLAVTTQSPDTPATTTAVLAHGWGATRALWRTVAPRLLAAGLRVVSYDQRGHGESGLGREGITIARVGRDLAEVLAETETRDAILVGHSGGAFGVLSHVTAGSVDRVRGMVLLAAAAHDQDTPHKEVKLMGNPVFHWALNRRFIGRKMLRHTLGDKPSGAVAELNRKMFAETPRAVRSDCFASSRGMDLREPLSRVAVPAVVLAGEKDKVVKPELGAVVADVLPRARHELIPGAGHMLPLETPELVIRAVTELAGR